MLDQVVLDLRYSWRALRKAPGFAVVAVLSLALGIGANAAIFSIINGVMLKMLPVSDPGRLVAFFNDRSVRGQASQPADYYTHPIFEQIRDHHQDALDGVMAYSPQMFDIGEGGEVQRVSGLFVSGGYFDVAGVRPWLGRTLSPDDDLRGGGSGADGPVAVISYGFWRDHFAASPAVLGQPLRLAGQSFTIVGVTPPGFFGLEVGKSFDVAIPLGTEPIVRGRENSSLGKRENWWLLMAGRLKPGQSIEQATAALRGMQPAIRQATLPEHDTLAQHFTDPLSLAPAATGVSFLRRDYRPALLTLMAIVGMVLLIACANLANLLLARATARQKEFAVRLALGASRGRLVRQMLTESIMLAIAGALLGLAFAQTAGTLIVRTLSSSRSPVFVDVSIDWRVLAFTIFVAAATILLFGAAPAFRSSSVSANDVLKSGGRGIARGWSWNRFNLEKLLVATQIALSLVLVFGASLFVRSFTTLTTLDPGFNASHVMQVATTLTRTAYAPAQRQQVYEQLRDAFAAIPGVESVAAVQIPPVRGDMSNRRVRVEGFTPKDQRDSLLLSNRVTPGYFKLLETPFYGGRDFTAHDTANAPAVVILNQAAVQKFFHGENPIGRAIDWEVERDTWQPLTVVGVVGNTAYQSLRETQHLLPLIYFPLTQQTNAPASTTFLLRTKGDTSSFAHAVTAAGSAINKNITFEFRTLEQQLADDVIQERLLAMLSGFFGGLALLVAGIGLYGMMSLAVTRRRNELGVRMALGADVRGIVSLVLRDVAAITAIGLIAGAAIAFASGRIVSKLLFGLTPADPTTFAIALLLLAGVALLAGFIPARRAARLDPMIALRDD